MSAESTQPRPLSDDQLARLLAERHEDATLPVLQAAAVRDAFDPFQLRPLSDVKLSRQQIIDELLAASEQITQGPHRGLWTLSLPERRRALRALKTRDSMKAALSANPAAALSPLQRMFEHAMCGAPFDLSGLSREELAALLTLTDWLKGVIDDLPSDELIRKTLARADLFSPMQRLAGNDFVNRTEEMAQLQDFVFGPKSPKPLFVFGPGGVGKSTLLAHFILKRIIRTNIPMVYIDSDRPAIRPEQPETVLLDAAMQLRQQTGSANTVADGLIRTISSSIGRIETTRGLESFTPSGPSQLIYQFADAFRSMPSALIILDTFEEAQFLGTDVVSNLLAQMYSLQDAHAGFRLVIAGRAFPREFASYLAPYYNPPLQHNDAGPSFDNVPLPWRPINLAVLDEKAALELLQLALASQGVEPLTPTELTSVIEIVSRNPMCMKLAARLLRQESVARLRSSRSEVLTRLKAEKIQALLYGRILWNLHSDDIRKVAYPGIIVRRIDADIVREVLAGPCGLQLEQPGSAQKIVADLAKEAALVEKDPADGSLRHRTDVRRAMLEDLADHVAPDIIQTIDRNAIIFYKDRPGAVARAEEIYHRLRLREPAATLEQRWIPDAARFLKTALDELPATERLWLASKLGATLDESVRLTANLEQWEEQAARSVKRLLQSRTPDQALSVLGERPDRSSRSNLFALEAEAYRMLNQPEAAIRAARAGVDSMVRAGAIDPAADLLLQIVVTEEARRDFSAAQIALREAEAVASHSSNDILRLRVAVTEIRLLREQPAPASDLDARRSQAKQMITADRVRALRGFPVLLREVAAEFSADLPLLAATALETLGIEVTSDASVQIFRQVLATFPQAGSEGALPLAFERLAQSPTEPAALRSLLTQSVSASDLAHLADLFLTKPPGSEPLRVLQDYFRICVDESSRSWIEAQTRGSIREKVVTADSLELDPEELKSIIGDKTVTEQAAIGEHYADLTDRLRTAGLGTDPDVLVAINDPEVSRLQSAVAERAQAGKALPTGGVGVKFGASDWLGWTKVIWQKLLRSAHPILRPETNKPDPLPDHARIAIVGAFGTGLYGAPHIARSILSSPGLELLAHLGGIYYSGTKWEVKERFLDLWPREAARRSIALNGNHEMYSGGYGYFNLALPALGQRSSYCAFANSHWLIVALDTAYVDFGIDAEQANWINHLVDQAGTRKVLFLSNHPLFSRFDLQGDKLQKALAPLLEGRRITAWYWAHEHQCILFDRHPRFGLFGRCLGNGGLPAQRRGDVKQSPAESSVGPFSWRRLSATDESPSCLVLDGPNSYIHGREEKYVPHGYMTIELNGADLIEHVFIADGTKVLSINHAGLQALSSGPSPS